MKALITEAIKNKNILQFMYDDKLRIVEPHVFGTSTKEDSSDLLRAYQIMGGSNSDNDLGWRLFSIDKINDINLSENTFDVARKYYNPDDSAMEEIYINI